MVYSAFKGSTRPEKGPAPLPLTLTLTLTWRGRNGPRERRRRDPAPPGGAKRGAETPPKARGDPAAARSRLRPNRSGARDWTGPPGVLAGRGRSSERRRGGAAGIRRGPKKERRAKAGGPYPRAERARARRGRLRRRAAHKGHGRPQAGPKGAKNARATHLSARSSRATTLPGATAQRWPRRGPEAPQEDAVLCPARGTGSFLLDYWDFMSPKLWMKIVS